MERNFLVVQLADRMEDAIRSGQWQGKAAGTRTLADRFGVNRKTCVAAMNLLQQRGLISAPEVGKRREILPVDGLQPPARSDTDHLLILHPAAGPINRMDKALLRSCGEAWEHSKGGVSWKEVDFSRYRDPGPVLERLIERYRATALVLHVPDGRWGEVAAERLPTFQFGGTHWSSPEVQSVFILTLRSYSASQAIRIRDGRFLVHTRMSLGGFGPMHTSILRARLLMKIAIDGLSRKDGEKTSS